MNLFFDTSALVKFFHEEEGSEAVSLIAEKEWGFVTTDVNLCKIAQLIGFNALNPLKNQ